MQPTALHWTSTLGLFICRMRGVRPPSETMRTLFWPEFCQRRGVDTSWDMFKLTIYGQIAQRGRSGSLYFDIRAFKEEEDGFECGAIYRSYICITRVSPSNLPSIFLSSSRSASSSPGHDHTSFCDFGKGQTSAPLEIDVLAVYQRAQRGKRFAGEEVGLGSLSTSIQVSIMLVRLSNIPPFASTALDGAGNAICRGGKEGEAGAHYIFEVIE